MAVAWSREVAAKQGFRKYYSASDAIGTKVSVRYRRSGHTSGVVVRRGFHFSTITPKDTNIGIMQHLGCGCSFSSLALELQ